VGGVPPPSLHPKPAKTNNILMAKSKENEVEVVEAVKTERELRWDAFLAKAEKENPVKFAVKKAKGAFDKIPELFV
jgi:5-hydroxyisourate hydrolase-like protein (transthyretin family)